MMDLDSNLIVNERIIRDLGMGDFLTAEGKVPSKPLPKQWETCRNMNGSWGYNSKKTKYKKTSELIHEMVTVVSRDGNYLLNIGPKGDGTVTEQEKKILNEFGNWMRIHGESIYGTTRSPFDHEPFWGFYTRKKDKLYAHVFEWPRDKLLTVPSSSKKATRICLLNNPGVNLDFTENLGNIVIKLPEKAPDHINSVVLIDFSDTTELKARSSHFCSETVVLKQCYKNSSKSLITVIYELQRPSRVEVNIYSQSGRRMEILFDKNQTVGRHELIYQLKKLSPGIYFLNLNIRHSSPINSFSEIRRLIFYE